MFVHCWTVASLAIHLNSAFQFKNHIFLFFGSNRLGIGLECVWYRGAEVKLTVDWTNLSISDPYFPVLSSNFPFSLALVNLSVSCQQWLKVSKVSEPFTYIFFFNCSFILSYQLWKYWRRQGTKKITVIFIFKHSTYLRADFDLSTTIDKNLCILRLTCVTLSRKYRCK